MSISSIQCTKKEKNPQNSCKYNSNSSQSIKKFDFLLLNNQPSPKVKDYTPPIENQSKKTVLIFRTVFKKHISDIGQPIFVLFHKEYHRPLVPSNSSK